MLPFLAAGFDGKAVAKRDTKKPARVVKPADKPKKNKKDKAAASAHYVADPRPQRVPPGELQPEPNRLPYQLPPIAVIAISVVWVVLIAGAFSALHLNLHRHDMGLFPRLVQRAFVTFVTAKKAEYPALKIVGVEDDQRTAYVQGNASQFKKEDEFRLHEHGREDFPIKNGTLAEDAVFDPATGTTKLVFHIPGWKHTDLTLLHGDEGFPSGYTYVGLIAGLLGMLATWLWGWDLVVLNKLEGIAQWKLLGPTHAFPVAFVLGMLLMNSQPIIGFICIASAGAMLLYVISHDTGRRGDPFPEQTPANQ